MRRSLAEMLEPNVARPECRLANVPRSKVRDWFIVFVTQKPRPNQLRFSTQVLFPFSNSTPPLRKITALINVRRMLGAYLQYSMTAVLRYSPKQTNDTASPS